MHFVSIILLAIFFIAAGANHFLHPQLYLKIIPPFLPFPGVINYLSGVAEFTGGIAVLVPQLRRAAGWGLVLLLLAVFPANLYMASHRSAWPTIPTWMLWARLPLQFVFIGWVYLTCLKKSRS